MGSPFAFGQNADAVDHLICKKLIYTFMKLLRIVESILPVPVNKLVAIIVERVDAFMCHTSPLQSHVSPIFDNQTAAF